MMWYAIAIVVAVIILMIAAGYYLTRSYFREYTSYAPSKAC
jgi:uncharacterized protein YneF (UPF0154 family)